MKNKFASLFLVAALALAGCSGLNDLKHTETGQPQQTQALAISPAAITLRGGTSQTFAATLNGSAETVTWSVNGTAGGNATIGTISVAGVFTAPEFPLSGSAVLIGATDVADSTKTASAGVVLQNPVPTVTSVNPPSISVGSYTLTVNGAHFAPGATASLAGSPLVTTRVSSTQLTATGTATSSQVGSVLVSVKNPDPGSTLSASQTVQITNATKVSVQVTPHASNVLAGGTVALTATVTGSANTAVAWSINGGAGNATTGSISALGMYSAPSSVPNPNTVTVTATSVADPSKSASAVLTITGATPAIASINPSSVGVGAFMMTVSGANFVNGSVVKFGGQSLTTMFVSSTELTATGTATAAQAGTVQVTVSNPSPNAGTSAPVAEQVVNAAPQVTSAAAVRFLEQSSFGPNTESVNQVRQAGFDGFLASQFGAPVTPYPTPAATDTSLNNVQNAFFLNAVTGQDQLRQRVGFALSELWVVSSNKVGDPVGYTNYMATLNHDALGNYYDVMKDVTLTPAMGHMLDMVNNDKPASGQHANENYARELMQLFTLGLSKMNPDGTSVLDSTGNPAPTYTQDDVMALGRSLTGWTFPTQPGMPLYKHNPSFYGGPMVVGAETNHDSGAKTFLGQSVSAGQTAEQELDSVLTIIFNHPNLPPFVSKQLIEKLVTSNPSPAYIQRVAQAFTTANSIPMVRASAETCRPWRPRFFSIAEARRGDDPRTTAAATDGKLREPVVMVSRCRQSFRRHYGRHRIHQRQRLNMSQSIFNPEACSISSRPTV